MNIKNEKNIAVVEFKSISRGIIATDEMIKAAAVKIVAATTLCPGKYLAIIEGDIPALEKSLDTAEKVARRHVFSSFIVSAVSAEVLDVIGGQKMPSIKDAVGIVESMQMANIINAADISLDSAEVELIEMRLGRGCGVNSYYIVTGKLAAVEESINKAAEFLKEQGALIACRVIANPGPELLRWLEPAACMC